MAAPSDRPAAKDPTAREGSVRRAFRAGDLLSQVVVQGLAVSPDGDSVVYVRRTVEDGQYVRRLWRVPFAEGPPVQITTAKSNDTRPRFSPDGASLLFTSDRSGKPQVWVIALDGSSPCQLTDLPEGAWAGEWSHDGKRVLFLAPSGQQRFIVGNPDDPTARQIRDYTWKLNGRGYRDQFISAWIVDVDGGKPVRVTQPTYDTGPACWSPDSRHIAFVADLREQAALIEFKQLWTVPSRRTDEAPRQAASLPGAIHNLAWAPSRRLAFLGNSQPNAPGWANVDLFVLEDGRPRQLGRDRDLDIWNRTYGDFEDDEQFNPPPLFWLDSEHAVGLVSRRGATHPYSFGIDGSVEALAKEDVVCNAIAVGGGRIAVAASGDGPADVYAVEGGKLRRLSRDGSSWFGPFQRRVEHVEVPHPDGHTIGAWFLRATGKAGRGPMVVDVHGGPNLSFGPSPWLEMIALADAGFHVIWSNPRGSGGYGETYARSRTRLGDKDASDILRVVDWAIGEGIADRDSVGIMGLSQGGFMTNWMLGRHPGVFKAAVSENPVTDLLAEYGGGDSGIAVARSAIDVDVDQPWDHIDAFLDRSPYTKIHLNTAPLLLLHCDQDLRVPAGQSEMVFTILRSLGREVEMVRYPDESHTMFMFGRPDRRVDRLERIVGWFSTHLDPGPPAENGDL